MTEVIWKMVFSERTRKVFKRRWEYLLNLSIKKLIPKTGTDYSKQLPTVDIKDMDWSPCYKRKTNVVDIDYVVGQGSPITKGTTKY